MSTNYTDKSVVQSQKNRHEVNDMISEMKVHMSDLNMKVCKFGKVEMDILFYWNTEHAPALGPLSLCHCKFVNEGAHV